jgi:hypothetical protein
VLARTLALLRSRRARARRPEHDLAPYLLRVALRARPDRTDRERERRGDWVPELLSGAPYSRAPFTTADFHMRTILLIVLILFLLGALPAWPYSHGWGYFPSGLLLLIVVLFLLVGGRRSLT